jgi:hypothetical protein
VLLQIPGGSGRLVVADQTGVIWIIIGKEPAEPFLRLALA